MADLEHTDTLVVVTFAVAIIAFVILVFASNTFWAGLIVAFVFGAAYTLGSKESPAVFFTLVGIGIIGLFYIFI